MLEIKHLTITFRDARGGEAVRGIDLHVEAGERLGLMLNEAQTYFFSAPWYALSAGGTIVLLILGFSLLSDGLGERR